MREGLGRGEEAQQGLASSVNNEHNPRFTIDRLSLAEMASSDPHNRNASRRTAFAHLGPINKNSALLQMVTG